MLASSRFNRADIDDPAPDREAPRRVEAASWRVARSLASRLPRTPIAALRARSQSRSSRSATAGGRGGTRAGWRFAPRPATGFPHSGREVRKLDGSLRSPTFTIDKPYLAIRVAGREAKARVILNGLQLIQEPDLRRPRARRSNHGDELRWLVFDLQDVEGAAGVPRTARRRPRLRGDPRGVVRRYRSRRPMRCERVPAPRIMTLASAASRTGGEDLPTPRRAPSMRDGTGINERVFVRGQPQDPGRRGAARRSSKRSASRRSPRAAAGGSNWRRQLTDPANPLVARVIVNRLWKHHFGEGIVRSPDDFGLQGQPPTHPELLDWLASEFVKTWSIKRMHRLMVLSAAYRQSSRATPEQAAKAVTADPQNKLLHRQNVRRLEAEAIRDAMLAVSGRLDRTMEGPGVLPHLTEHQVGRGKPAQRAARRQRPAEHLPRGAAELPEPDVHRVRLPDAVHHHRPADGVERPGAGARDAEQPVRAAAGGVVGEAGARRIANRGGTRRSDVRGRVRSSADEGGTRRGASGSSRSSRRSTASRTTRRRGPTSPTSCSTPRSSSSWSDRTLEKPVFRVAILFFCIQALSLPLVSAYLPNRLEIPSFLHFRRGRVATQDRNSLRGLSIYMATCGHASDPPDSIAFSCAREGPPDAAPTVVSCQRPMLRAVPTASRSARALRDTRYCPRLWG